MVDHFFFSIIEFNKRQIIPGSKLLLNDSLKISDI